MNSLSPVKKSTFVLPNAITAIGLLLGLLVIFRMSMVEPGTSSYETISSVALLLLLSAIADFADGFLARWMRVQTQFGLLFDSLNDAITFGVAPAVIVLKTLSPEAKTIFAFWASAGAMTYCLCGVLRLARYSVQKSVGVSHISEEKHLSSFTGLPIPSACCAIVSLTLFMSSELFEILGLNLNELRAPVLIGAQFFLGALMVSRWKFPAMANISALQISFLNLTLMACSAAILFYFYCLHPSLALLVLVWGYILLSLLRDVFYWLRGFRELAIAERWQWWS